MTDGVEREAPPAWHAARRREAQRLLARGLSVFATLLLLWLPIYYATRVWLPDKVFTGAFNIPLRLELFLTGLVFVFRVDLFAVVYAARLLAPNPEWRREWEEWRVTLLTPRDVLFAKLFWPVVVLAPLNVLFNAIFLWGSFDRLLMVTVVTPGLRLEPIIADLVTITTSSLEDVSYLVLFMVVALERSFRHEGSALPAIQTVLIGMGLGSAALAFGFALDLALAWDAVAVATEGFFEYHMAFTTAFAACLLALEITLIRVFWRRALRHLDRDE